MAWPVMPFGYHGGVTSVFYQQFGRWPPEIIYVLAVGGGGYGGIYGTTDGVGGGGGGGVQDWVERATGQIPGSDSVTYSVTVGGGGQNTSVIGGLVSVTATAGETGTRSGGAQGFPNGNGGGGGMQYQRTYYIGGGGGGAGGGGGGASANGRNIYTGGGGAALTVDYFGAVGGGGAGSYRGSGYTNNVAGSGGGYYGLGGGGNGNPGCAGIKYAGTQAGLGGTISSINGYTYHTFTGNGTVEL